MLPAFYFLLIAVCILPTLPGLLGVVITALGYMPPLGLTQFSFNGFSQVLQWQGVEHAIALTFYTTAASCFLACLFTFAIIQTCWGTRLWQRIESALSPLLAIPHVAFAIGFAFLFAPTGMGVRLLYSLLPTNLSTHAVSETALLINDPYGLGLIFMLALKETPFLVLMSIPVLQQLNIEQTQKVSASLGYNRAQTWLKCIFPQWLPKMRFPLFAIVAYGVSVVDVAQIIGPTNPPTFAVLVWQWFIDPNLQLMPRAAAGAIMLFVIGTILLGITVAIEWLLTQCFKQWQWSGRYGFALPGKSLFTLLLALTALIIPILSLWSVALRWRFPDVLPTRYSLRFWQLEWSHILSTINISVVIALISASIGLCFAIVAHEFRIKHKWHIPNYIIAIPMMIPQLSLLFGLQVLTLFSSLNTYLLWVCWAHLFFVFPYVYLAIDGPYRSYDQRLTQIGLSLGKTPFQVWLKIKLPQLSSAFIFAWVIGISVSLAQYLPTLMLGAGRISTLTTEAVTLASGSDRRVTAIYALCQALLPLGFFILARRINRRKTINV
ncbi:thiamine ABC transporter permease [Photobacterium angustum]|uniref:Thiamine ABC transporter permease n=1 Tax=Photobacterium angustum TaxID=661 RepID=A0A855SFX4_PHOAN|nr:ABC transporter permease subunit [Photobacterium angustum]KJG34641.1 thiamine ABC transporter permease [Photobacterium angustum]KJG42059.1 thiamine ABC transporter permease [Photobacterium angustum]KJG50805.1 thiamine ABC transporter permease [Photobacterium angustum]KJG54665.1 thiamine ABC transporter permease [Photobacterium angustum]PSW90821.1 thiamine ABC transporter permease [Photobacterium angustum]